MYMYYVSAWDCLSHLPVSEMRPITSKEETGLEVEDGKPPKTLGVLHRSDYLLTCLCRLLGRCPKLEKPLRPGNTPVLCCWVGGDADRH
jgi:hypothetical protein